MSDSRAQKIWGKLGLLARPIDQDVVLSFLESVHQHWTTDWVKNGNDAQYLLKSRSATYNIKQEYISRLAELPAPVRALGAEQASRLLFDLYKWARSYDPTSWGLQPAKTLPKTPKVSIEAPALPTVPVPAPTEAPATASSTTATATAPIPVPAPTETCYVRPPRRILPLLPAGPDGAPPAMAQYLARFPTSYEEERDDGDSTDEDAPFEEEPEVEYAEPLTPPEEVRPLMPTIEAALLGRYGVTDDQVMSVGDLALLRAFVADENPLYQL
ncbi:hypothetical protein N7535_007281 [Penicillium sp. DV-2018c]|nr:hypothetical protein N7461_003308 [Penicillium sp. DV-2018c]KAJ5565643.1 hypothetical protein N7535_007281 [Penicillium sp. DV-2018c]